MKLELRQGECPRINGQELKECISIVVEATHEGTHASIFVRDPDFDIDLDSFVLKTTASWWQRLRRGLRI